MKYFIIFFLVMWFNLSAQIPNGYYDGTEGLSGNALRSVLHNIIDNHYEQSYSSLWDYFAETDRKANGKVWDIYSDIPGGTPPYEYTFYSDQCGQYNSEGDCYNREHSWPQSWFNEGSPMKSDLFHVYPTDGYVNGMRGNLPYGEVSSPDWISMNGSKKGPCSFPGYSGDVFEPIDEYKGDVARSFFYMCTRYYNEDSGWQNNGMVNGANLRPWAVNLLAEWHTEDPVSQKEIDRNEAIYSIQNNRNPFIDHPEFAGLIWGFTSSEEITIENDFLVSAFPNPFTNEVIFSFAPLDNPQKFKIDIYNLKGQQIKSLSIFDYQTSISWNGKNFSENKVESGIYLYRLTKNRKILKTGKIVYIK